jgi:hypothetical protein
MTVLLSSPQRYAVLLTAVQTDENDHYRLREKLELLKPEDIITDLAFRSHGTSHS